MDCILKQFLAFIKLIIIVCSYIVIWVQNSSINGLNPEYNEDVICAKAFTGIAKKEKYYDSKEI